MASYAVKGKSLPEWFRLLPPNAMVNTRDAAKLFGLTEQCLRNEAHSGDFPKASTYHKGFLTNKACMWKPAVLLTEWKRRGGLT